MVCILAARPEIPRRRQLHCQPRVAGGMCALHPHDGRMIVYPIGASSQLLVFTDPVLNHFEKPRQRKWWHREAGGQLSARFDLPRIVIEEATGPRRTDWRTRYSYRPNRR